MFYHLNVNVNVISHLLSAAYKLTMNNNIIKKHRSYNINKNRILIEVHECGPQPNPFPSQRSCRSGLQFIGELSFRSYGDDCLILLSWMHLFLRSLPEGSLSHWSRVCGNPPEAKVCLWSAE